jgi:hypothetical protein
MDPDSSFRVVAWRGFSVFSPCSPCIPISFQTVQERVPRDVPDGTSVLWIWFAQNSTALYINWNSGEHNCFHFATRVQMGASIGGMPHVPKKLLMGPSIWLLELYICQCAHNLIILNHKLLTPLYNVGIDCTWFEKKKLIYCSIRRGTFSKSTTVHETITAGKGVPSNLTPYCNPMFSWALFQRFVTYLLWEHPVPC